MKLEDYDWLAIQADYDAGYTFHRVTEKYGIANASLTRAVKLGLFKSRPPNYQCKTNNPNFDWREIQRSHDEGLSQRELSEKYGVSSSTIRSARDKGLLKLRTPSAASRMGYSRHGTKTKVTKETFVERSTEIHGRAYDYTDVTFTTVLDKVSIYCRRHQGYFSQYVYDHMRGYGCPICGAAHSAPEDRFLSLIGIEYENRHLTIHDETGRYYKIDGFDPDTNTIYEFDGDFWHGNPSLFDADEINPRTKTTFGQLYEKTVSRRMALEELGYNVVAIWEAELVDFIKEWDSECSTNGFKGFEVIRDTTISNTEPMKRKRKSNYTTIQCECCGKITFNQRFCSHECSVDKQRKDRLSMSDVKLYKFVVKHGFNFSKAGLLLGISDNAIRKRLKKAGYDTRQYKVNGRDGGA